MPATPTEFTTADARAIFESAINRPGASAEQSDNARLLCEWAQTCPMSSRLLLLFLLSGCSPGVSPAPIGAPCSDNGQCEGFCLELGASAPVNMQGAFCSDYCTATNGDSCSAYDNTQWRYLCGHVSGAVDTANTYAPAADEYVCSRLPQDIGGGGSESVSGGPDSACCKTCSGTSYACGDSCISVSNECHVGPGCAC